MVYRVSYFKYQFFWCCETPRFSMIISVLHGFNKIGKFGLCKNFLKNSLIYLYKLVNLLNKITFTWWNICPGKLKVVFRHTSRRANMYKKATIQWNLCRRQTSLTRYSYVFARKLTWKVILKASKWHKTGFSIFISLWVRADRLSN